MTVIARQKSVNSRHNNDDVMIIRAGWRVALKKTGYSVHRRKKSGVYYMYGFAVKPALPAAYFASSA
jgi:hypothetical protein